METTPFHIAQIVVGTVAQEFDDDERNQNNAFHFLSTEIAKHENEVAVVIRRDDDYRIGEIWASWSALPFTDNIGFFRHYLALNGFYYEEEV